jgi:phospho-N-acetylmuramoyl-pentapeptide-transferase
VIQIVSFRTTGRRVFRMVPLHRHFEPAGWSEVNIVVRFWIVAGVCVAAGLASSTRISWSPPDRAPPTE